MKEAVAVKKQADRIVLNLEDSPIQLDAMKKQLDDWPIEGLKEVIVIKDGQVIPFWP
jgi:contact-dependent growth inhibition (CDI) system CdiA-like toxin